jgi:hypothetical protein
MGFKIKLIARCDEFQICKSFLRNHKISKQKMLILQLRTVCQQNDAEKYKDGKSKN